LEYIHINNIDFDVSRVAIGTWAIGGWLWGGTDKEKAFSAIISGLEKGINIIDTAPVYGFGLSEEICGKAIKEFGNRDKIVIATKLGLEWNSGKVFRNSSRKRILKEIDDSLRRLQTDYIDIYQVHWHDGNTQAEETAETLLQLKERNKIRAIGVSNYSVSQMREFQKFAKIDTLQPPYNIFEREIEKDILPYCKNSNINVLAYGSICRGLLSGKMTKERVFNGDDIRKSDKKFSEKYFGLYLNIVKKLDDFANKNYNKRVIDLAVRWILDKGIDIALWGVRSPEQLDDIDGVWDWKLDGTAMKEIDKILNSLEISENDKNT